MLSACNLPTHSLGSRFRFFASAVFCLGLTLANSNSAEAQVYFSDSFSGNGELGASWTRSNFRQSGGYAYATSPTWALNPYLNYANIQVVADVMIPTTRTSEQSISILGRAAIRGINGQYEPRGPEARIYCPVSGQCELRIEHESRPDQYFSITPLNLPDNTGIKHWRGRLSLVIENNIFTACVAGVCDKTRINSSFTDFPTSGAVGIRATPGVYFDTIHAGAVGTVLPGTAAQVPPASWNFTDQFDGATGLLGGGWYDRDLRKSGGYVYSLYSNRETLFQQRMANRFSVKVSGFVPLQRSNNQMINIFGWGKLVQRADGKGPVITHATAPEAVILCDAGNTQICKFRLGAGRQSQQFDVTLQASNIINGHAKVDLELIVTSTDVLGCINNRCTSVPNTAYGNTCSEYGKPGFGMSQGVYVDSFFAGSPR